MAAIRSDQVRARAGDVEDWARTAETCLRALVGEQAGYDVAPMLELYEATRHESGPNNSFAALRQSVGFVAERWSKALVCRNAEWLSARVDDSLLSVEERCSFVEALSRVEPETVHDFVMANLVTLPGLLYRAAGRVASADDLEMLMGLHDVATNADERKWYSSAIKTAGKRLGV